MDIKQVQADLDKKNEALKISERRLNRTQELAHLGIWELDLINNQLTWSDEVYRIFGLDPQKFGATYEAFLEAVHPEDRKVVNDAYSGSLRGGKDYYEIEHRIVRKATGEVRYVHEKCEHTRDSSGKIIRSIGMVHDITDRKIVEEALRNEKQERQVILETVPAMIFYKNRENTFVRTNKAFEEVMRLPKEKLEGRSLFEIYPKEQADAFWKDDKEVIATGQPKLNIIEPMETPAGKRWVQTGKIPYRDEMNNIIGIIGFAVDITEQKKTKELLERDKKTLEQYVLKRTEELLKSYREIEKMKRLSDLGELAATVAHELRNPLAAINLASYNLKKKTSNPELEKHFLTITKKIKESNEIINNLLSFSRVKAPIYDIVNIFDLLDENIENMAEQYASKNIIINKSFEELKNISVQADQIQLKSLFTNIINNACEACLDHAEGRKIEVIGSVEGDNLNIQFKDNGSGIDKENIEKVFNPFFSTKAKGTGLGLAVCNQITRLHNGKIAIESEKDSGTVVSITLPLKKHEYTTKN
ncbi:MAG: hypothetical protein A3J83_08605 [Elusimicrobia bacterium RIFOXYA2_FULL_40_6]|nr:MAG: hypothetical protein A3J83_08605 [Elusimicrobia bacterium RIFOXYA2_FULL_40_6]